MDIDIDGLRIHWEGEDGPTRAGMAVVLVHGSPRSSRSFRRTIARLAPTWRVLAPDLPGFGRSDKPLDGLAFPALAELLRGWLDRVAGDRYVLVGQGSGGPLALAAARPERVRALVLANTTFRPDARPRRRWLPLTAPFLGELLVDLVGRSPALAEEYRRALASRGTRRTVLRLLRREGWAEVADRASACAAVPRPTLLLWGETDRWSQDGEVEWLRRVLPGADLVRLPGGGHFPQEDAADAFADALLSFLGRPGVS